MHCLRTIQTCAWNSVAALILLATVRASTSSSFKTYGGLAPEGRPLGHSRDLLQGIFGYSPPAPPTKSPLGLFPDPVPNPPQPPPLPPLSSPPPAISVLGAPPPPPNPPRPSPPPAAPAPGLLDGFLGVVLKGLADFNNFFISLAFSAVEIVTGTVAMLTGTPNPLKCNDKVSWPSCTVRW